MHTLIYVGIVGLKMDVAKYTQCLPPPAKNPEGMQTVKENAGGPELIDNVVFCE